MRTIPLLSVAITVAVLCSRGSSDLRAQSTDAQDELLAQYRQAEALSEKGRIDDAIKLYERIVERAPEVFGVKTRNTSNMMNNLAELYRRKQEYGKAQPLYERSLKINEDLLGKDDLAVAASLENLSQNYYEQKDYTNAEPLLLRCIQIREKKLGKNDLKLGASLASLAIMYFESGRYAEAEPLFERVLAIREAGLGKDDVMVGVTLNGLALVHREMGRYSRAIPLNQRSTRIFEAAFGKDDPNVASLLGNLAVLYRDLGQYDKSEPLFLRALAIRESKQGKDHPDVGTVLNNLAALYIDMRQYDKAEPLYERSLRIVETKQGKDHPDVAIVLSNLATLYLRSGQAAKAEAPLQRALKLLEARFGPDHPQMATLLLNLAVLHRAQGDDARAESFGQRALKIQEAKLGPHHPDVGITLNLLAKLEAAQDHAQPALELADRMRRLDRRHAARSLSVLAENEQLAFLNTTDRRHLRVAFTLALESKAPGAAALSAAWALNGKAIAHQTLAERALLARDARNTKAAPLVGELLSVRRQLTGLVLAPYAEAKQAERLKEIARLTAREKELSAQLGAAVGRPTRDDPWVELTEVRRAIPRDAVLVEIVRFDVVDLKGRTALEEVKGSRYVAWLIPPAEQGEVKLVDLGDAEAIDRAVETVREGFRAAQGSAKQKSTILEKGEADAEKELQPALAILGKLILEPLADVLADRKQWIISPDGGLWLVPWAALPIGKTPYVIEQHQVHYVISGRELAAPATKAPAKRDPCLLVADPDFDLDPKEAGTIAAKLLGEEAPATDAQGPSSSPEGITTAGILGKVARLEATGQEATEIKPSLQKYAGEEPWVYRRKNALEAVVKSFRSPKVMVLSTHGFFLPAQQFKRDERGDLPGTRRPLLAGDGGVPENPLLRCGLLLAGCNRTERVKSNPEDGVLTGLEIVSLELRGTELVVLSACETGLGQVRDGEGVAGLRQAFHLAGAKTVVASLWQVADRDTALLMSDFFNALARGKSKAEALREAQLARLKAHRDRYGAAHPFFWAAFTATGN